MANLIIDIRVEEVEEGLFLAQSDDLPGLLAEGRSYNEALEIAQDVARKLTESYLEHNDTLPDKIQKQINTKRRVSRFKIPVIVTL